MGLSLFFLWLSNLMSCLLIGLLIIGNVDLYTRLLLRIFYFFVCIAVHICIYLSFYLPICFSATDILLFLFIMLAYPVDSILSIFLLFHDLLFQLCSGFSPLQTISILGLSTYDLTFLIGLTGIIISVPILPILFCFL
jgi:hypothetical protein